MFHNAVAGIEIVINRNRELRVRMAVPGAEKTWASAFQFGGALRMGCFLIFILRPFIWLWPFWLWSGQAWWIEINITLLPRIHFSLAVLCESIWARTCVCARGSNVPGLRYAKSYLAIDQFSIDPICFSHLVARRERESWKLYSASSTFPSSILQRAHLLYITWNMSR